MSTFEFAEDALLFSDLLRSSLEQTNPGEDHSAPGPRVREAISVAEPGQVWVVDPPDSGLSCMVILTRTENIPYRCVVATDQLWLAAVDDVIVPEDANSTGTALAACLWRDVPVAPGSLSTLLGTILLSQLEVIQMLLQRSLSGGFATVPLCQVSRAFLAGCDNAERTLLRWRITAPDGSTGEAVTGSRIVTEDDPRLELRSLFERATSHVEQAALAQVVFLQAEEEAAAPTPAVPLHERLLLGLRNALTEFGAAFAPPTAAAMTRAASPASQPDLSSQPIQTSFDMGDVSVDLDIRATPSEFTLQAAVFQGEEPVHGVRITLTMTAPDQEPRQFVRETGDEGVVFATSLPVRENASYEISIAHEGRQVTLRCGDKYVQDRGPNS